MTTKYGTWPRNLVSWYQVIATHPSGEGARVPVRHSDVIMRSVFKKGDVYCGRWQHSFAIAMVNM